MIAQFSEGDWVFYNNPGHQFHMTMFQLQKIVPHQYDPMTGVTVQEQGYQLVYGARSVFAYSGQILHRKDPQIQQNVLTAIPTADIATGDELDRIGLLYGVSRGSGEPDSDYRDRVYGQATGRFRVSSSKHIPNSRAILKVGDKVVGTFENIGTNKNAHEGHEVVENYAGGKNFKYCRKCKVEVFE